MRGPRAERPIALLALGIGLFVLCVIIAGVIWFQLDPGRSASKKTSTANGDWVWMPPARDRGKAPIIAPSPFLGPLPLAARSWWESRGPERLVIDQVCLVPDVPTFLAAIGEWNDRIYFPILIDNPAWTLPFLRAFRPSRVIRLPARALPGGREALWSAAARAVGRSWSPFGRSESEPQDGSRVPTGLGRTPPGVVLSEPESSSLAGGVALAAGRFQPLVRFEPWKRGDATDDREPRQSSDRGIGFSTVLSLAEARSFSRRLEDRIATVVSDYRGLGDSCDFLTLAGEWPFRYLNDRETGPARGEAALDDLIARNVESELANVGKSKDRWAFAGRLLGDAPASVYRAMCALFLPPDAAVLWNTYGGSEPWNHYGMNQADEILSRVISGPIRHRAGMDANLVNWHQVTANSADQTRLVFFNSSGEPKRFAIAGGSGRPADIPPGGPSAVIMIHSFSAANPNDPRTIAGRWLLMGAFTYYGSINEPYLSSFRPPALETELLAAGVPMAAAVREGSGEPFGQPWRLVYLGDPLYRLGIRTTRSDRDDPRADRGNTQIRIEPGRWDKVPDSRGEPYSTVEALPKSPAASVSADASLRWCFNAAIVAACSRGGEERSDGAGSDTPDWLPILESIRRERLDAGLRPAWEALIIDAILRLKDERQADPLYERLASVPVAEWSPRVEAMVEYWTIHRLASTERSENLPASFAIWNEAIRRPWPVGSEFPSQLTERVGGSLVNSANEIRDWYTQLKRAEADVAANPSVQPALAVVSAERKRVESKLAGKP